MTEYLRPGVYTERMDASAPGISVIRTDIAAFVGIARCGPLDTPVPLQSFRQFQAHFGDFTGQGYLAYVVRAFFENGGQRCWVVRVASQNPSTGARTAAITVGSASQAAWGIEAANAGSWGNQLTVALRSQHSAQTDAPPHHSTPHYATVVTVAGFARGTLVRLNQADGSGGVIEQWRVISHVDPDKQRLYWVHPDPGRGLAYDAVVVGFDRNRPITVASLSYSLLVHRDGRLLAHYRDLSLVPEHARYGPDVLGPAKYPVRFQAGRPLPAAPSPVVIRDLRKTVRAIPKPLVIDENHRVALIGGQDGLATLTPRDFMGESPLPLDSDAVQTLKRRGIEALHQVDEIAIVAVPDIVIRPEADPVFDPQPPAPVDPCQPCPPAPEPQQPFAPRGNLLELPPVFTDAQVYQVQAALVAHCEQRGDRFAVLDPPFGAARQDQLGQGAISAWRARFDTSYAALYYAWLKVTEPRGTATVRDIPPCGHVIGQYAFHDRVVGVHKAAANRPLVWAQDVTAAVDDGTHEVLNPLGINVIRDELGRGLRIMGARTLSSDPDWRYVNVRRLLLMIREAVDLSLQWVAFEPNNPFTRNKLKLALNSFLTALWQRGALSGASAAQAFFVKCDEENNPPDPRANGQLLAQVGVATSNPFEFVILRVGRKGNELEIAEVGFISLAA